MDSITYQRKAVEQQKMVYKNDASFVSGSWVGNIQDVLRWYPIQLNIEIADDLLLSGTYEYAYSFSKPHKTGNIHGSYKDGDLLITLENSNIIPKKESVSIQAKFGSHISIRGKSAGIICGSTSSSNNSFFLDGIIAIGKRDPYYPPLENYVLESTEKYYYDSRNIRERGNRLFVDTLCSGKWIGSYIDASFGTERRLYMNITREEDSVYGKFFLWDAKPDIITDVISQPPITYDFGSVSGHIRGDSSFLVFEQVVDPKTDFSIHFSLRGKTSSHNIYQLGVVNMKEVENTFLVKNYYGWMSLDKSGGGFTDGVFTLSRIEPWNLPNSDIEK